VIKKAVTRNRFVGPQRNDSGHFPLSQRRRRRRRKEEEDLEGVWCAVGGKGVFYLVFVLIIA
jgi:hypothetical protein